MRTYPGATKTFSVYRSGTQKVGNNIVPVAAANSAPVATGVSVIMKDMQGMLAAEKGGVVFTGLYVGHTFSDANILIGDLLADEAENDKNGNPVRYQVQGASHGALNLKLHLRRTDIN
jgi:hypothetical protein